MDSSKSEKRRAAFKRLASQRTTAVLERLRILGNCANPQLYDYTDEDVRRMFRAIDRELRTVKAKFNNSRRPEFNL